MRFSAICIYALYFLMHSAIACVVTDDAGNKINLSSPAQRIIVLAPDLTEILFSIGAAQQVIGIIKGADYPHQAQLLPIIGSYHGLDLERILTLHPDLIVVWGSQFMRQLHVLQQGGVPVYIAEPKRLDDVARTMLNLGCLTGHVALAAQRAKYYRDVLQDLRRQYHAERPVTVFFQIGDSDLITINRESWINEALQICGGRNIFANARMAVPKVDLEALIRANPEAIMSDAPSGVHTPWRAQSHLRAVRNYFLFNIESDLIDRAGPRLPLGVRQICQNLVRVRA